MRTILALFLLPLVLHAADIKLGFVYPLSGEYAFVGDALRSGVQMAHYEMNQSGQLRHNYELVFEDCAFVPAVTAMVANKLINVNKVDALMSVWGPGAQIVGPIAARNNVVHLANDWDTTWVEKLPTTLDISGPSDEYARLQIDMIKQQGHTRIAWIQQNSSDWNNAAKQFLAMLKEHPELELVRHEKFTSPLRDFRTTLSKVALDKPDIVLVWSILPESEIILKQNKELGLNLNITGFFEDISETSLMGERPFICFTNPTGKFVEAYRAHYGTDAPLNSNWGYDAFTLLAKAYESFPADQKPSTAELMEAAKTLQPWTGAAGTITSRGNGIFEERFKVVRFKDGKIVWAKEFDDYNSR